MCNVFCIQINGVICVEWLQVRDLELEHGHVGDELILLNDMMGTVKRIKKDNKTNEVIYGMRIIDNEEKGNEKDEESIFVKKKDIKTCCKSFVFRYFSYFEIVLIFYSINIILIYNI